LAVVAGLASWAIIVFKPSPAGDAALATDPNSRVRELARAERLRRGAAGLRGRSGPPVDEHAVRRPVRNVGRYCFNVAPGVQTGKFPGWNHDGLTVFGVGYRC